MSGSSAAAGGGPSPSSTSTVGQQQSSTSAAPQAQQSLRVSVLTWNVAGSVPSRQCADKLRARMLYSSRMPDLIFLGLQEVVELKANALASYYLNREAPQRLDVWEPFVQRLGFHVVGKEQMVGLALWILVRPTSHQQQRDAIGRASSGLRVTACDIEQIRTAAMGMIGTKGALVSSLRINVTSGGQEGGAAAKTMASQLSTTLTLCGINVHLPSGEGPECIEERKHAVSQIFASLGARVPYGTRIGCFSLIEELTGLSWS
ncbi:unnamed protein product [Amoebophrya sp. A25]|nr:unnamed protein product [Amoebophrya sp. A25]|eukprot:GSA25T00027217001.1